LLKALSSKLDIHVVTADTFGLVKREMANLPVKVEILPSGRGDERKVEYVRKLGVESCVCIGNGRNDKLMLSEAALGICLLQAEGASAATLAAADIVSLSAHDAINLLLHPKRLAATLRV
jgi:soluble P-type ATPase